MRHDGGPFRCCGLYHWRKSETILWASGVVVSKERSVSEHDPTCETGNRSWDTPHGPRARGGHGRPTKLNLFAAGHLIHAVPSANPSVIGRPPKWA